MNKRVLFIGYFYPDANMGGVRVRRIARLLPQFGWDPVVLTHTRGRDSVDEETSGVRIEEVAAPDLTRIYRMIRRRREAGRAVHDPAPAQPQSLRIGLTSEINRWLMIPDKQIPWRSAAVQRGRYLLSREKFSVIFASQEPRTSLLVAARLSMETGVPCVLEYRDLWTGNPYYHITQPTALHRWIHRRLERGALRQAARVSAVSRGIAEYLAKTHGPLLRSPVELNYNFFDPREYPVKEFHAAPTAPFTVSYTGALYGNRKPHEFFRGMQAFIKQLSLTPRQFRFQWAGSASGIDDLDSILDQTEVRAFLDFLGQVSHREALRLLQQSDAALMIQAPDDSIHIPGKLFEAMGARVPVLALAHPCEVTEIIERCRAGVSCLNAMESVTKALTELYQAHSTNRRWSFDESELDRFSANQAVGKLAALFGEVAI